MEKMLITDKNKISAIHYLIGIYFGCTTQKEKSRKRLFLFVLFTILFSLFTFL